ncbi:galactokinase [uncultured Williamsia sp.]|uniref:galactokinase n=1 Tax=uncultured Williamsia sp. TaxID=259311 RepID=UPI00260C80A6|nr:galactokinase [uncultured Williamsia sp.]
MTGTVIASAPGRVNLIGEHTDYNDGFALPIALDRHTEVTLRRTDYDAVTVRAEGHGEARFRVDIEPGDVTGWAAYVAGVFWAAHEAGVTVSGADLTITSTVPVGAGLSSSAALECAVLTAISAAAGVVLDPIQAARIAQTAENDYVGAPTGLLDQVASMCGRDGHALLVDFADTSVEAVPFDPTADGVELVVVDSRTTHGHAGGEYSARRDSCERAARDLGVAMLREVADDDLDEVLAAVVDPVDRLRARHVVTENRRVLDAVQALRARDLPTFGLLMDCSHASMRDDFAITTPVIDRIAEVARRHGALGARMTGGGFGGSVIALMPPDAIDGMTAALHDEARAADRPSPEVRVARAGAGAQVITPR